MYLHNPGRLGFLESGALSQKVGNREPTPVPVTPPISSPSSSDPLCALMNLLLKQEDDQVTYLLPTP